MKAFDSNYELEKQLGDVFAPITPQTDFVSDLQARLRKKAQVAVERPDYLIMILLIISGLFMGVLLFWMLRTIFNLFHDE